MLELIAIDRNEGTSYSMDFWQVMKAVKSESPPARKTDKMHQILATHVLLKIYKTSALFLQATVF